MKRGLTFEIPNEYGHFLGKALQPIDLTSFHWRIGNEESYLIENGTLGADLFPNHIEEITGEDLTKLLQNNTYYTIFVDLQAFPPGEVSAVDTYEDFLTSSCQVIVLVVDCSYVTIYCKNQQAIALLYQQAVQLQFENVAYITDENDTRTRLSAW